MNFFSNEGSEKENASLITARVIEVRFINEKEGNRSLEIGIGSSFSVSKSLPEPEYVTSVCFSILINKRSENVIADMVIKLRFIQYRSSIENASK